MAYNLAIDDKLGVVFHHIVVVGNDENPAIFISPEQVFEVVGSGAVTVIDPIDLSYSSMGRASKKTRLACLTCNCISWQRDAISTSMNASLPRQVNRAFDIAPI